MFTWAYVDVGPIQIVNTKAVYSASALFCWALGNTKCIVATYTACSAFRWPDCFSFKEIKTTRKIECMVCE